MDITLTEFSLDMDPRFLGIIKEHIHGAAAITGLVMPLEAAPGARAQEPDVVGNLHDGAGHNVARAAHLDHGVVGGEGLELVGRRDEGEAGEFRHFGGNLTQEKGGQNCFLRKGKLCLLCYSRIIAVPGSPNNLFFISTPNPISICKL